MEYNTQRSKLIISEYGRNIQIMAELACEIKDRETRNRAARSIIQLMAIMTPQVREEENYERKLWDHLHTIAHFELDVDCPYPMPDPSATKPKGNKPNYPKRKMRFAHYGNLVEGFIKKGTELEEGPEKEALAQVVANMMKRNYLNWNRDSVNDEMIKEQLKELSAGKLNLKEDFRLMSTSEILQQNKVNSQAGHVSQKVGGGNKKAFKPGNKKKKRF
ncbi:MAG: DUF4290 domain-containing protein [Flavobacteriales bacterium]|nr:DUF4290 domain-containing protein [Flavobacteriales bacterium]